MACVLRVLAGVRFEVPNEVLGLYRFATRTGQFVVNVVAKHPLTKRRSGSSCGASSSDRSGGCWRRTSRCWWLFCGSGFYYCCPREDHIPRGVRTALVVAPEWAVAQVAADMFNRTLRFIEALLPSSLGARVRLVPEQTDPFPATSCGAVPTALLRSHELEEACVDTPPANSQSAGQLVVGPADLRLEFVRRKPDGLENALEHDTSLRGQGVLSVAEGSVDHSMINLELALFRLLRLRVPVWRGGWNSLRTDCVRDLMPDLRDW